MTAEEKQNMHVIRGDEIPEYLKRRQNRLFCMPECLNGDMCSHASVCASLRYQSCSAGRQIAALKNMNEDSEMSVLNNFNRIKCVCVFSA